MVYYIYIYSFIFYYPVKRNTEEMELTINKWFVQYKYIKINDNLLKL